MSVRHVVRFLVVGSVAVGLALAAYLAVSADVEVQVDGEIVRARTVAADVAELLAELGVSVGAADEVVPTLGTPLADGLAVSVVRAVTAEIVLQDRAGLLGLEDDRFVVTRVMDTLGELLAASPAAGAVDLEARFQPDLDQVVRDGSRLLVDIAVPSVVRVDGTELVVSSHGSDVGAALRDAGVELGADDRVAPPVTTPLEDAGPITVARVEVVEEEVDVVVDHDRSEQRTDDLLDGERLVATEGRDGLRRDTYEVVLVDGAEASRRRVGQRVVEEAVDEVVLVGTRQPPPPPPPPSEPPPASAAGAASSGQGAVVYLTFDDGPHPTYTPQLLDLLAAYEAQASFFVLGSQVVRFPDLVARLVRAGHAVGNHTWSHPRLPGLAPAALSRELLDTQDAIQRAAGITPACLRPPYGDRDAAVTARAAELGLRMTLWDLDPRDWARPATAAIVDHVLAQVRPGSVVLLHDGQRGREQTVAATAQLLAALTERGYELRALPGC
jgi:peptidoglycan/xylan/chitin deacetylase (PgdA/CDA1 family)